MVAGVGPSGLSEMREMSEPLFGAQQRRRSANENLGKPLFSAFAMSCTAASDSSHLFLPNAKLILFAVKRSFDIEDIEMTKGPQP